MFVLLGKSRLLLLLRKIIVVYIVCTRCVILFCGNRVYEEV